LEVALLRRSGYLPWLQDLVIAGSAAAAVALVAARLPRLPGRPLTRTAFGTALLALLAAPAAWSATTRASPGGGACPGAGPDFVSGLTAHRGGGFVGPGFGGARRFGPPSGGGFFRAGPPGGGRAFVPSPSAGGGNGPRPRTFRGGF